MNNFYYNGASILKKLPDSIDVHHLKVGEQPNQDYGAKAKRLIQTC